MPEKLQPEVLESSLLKSNVLAASFSSTITAVAFFCCEKVLCIQGLFYLNQYVLIVHKQVLFYP